jgi:hypothetical protein
MPDRTSCDEAMLLSRARLRVQDLDLKRGAVQRMTTQAPWGIQGGFAVVYKFATASGKMRALRCFLTPVAPDVQDRYERIAAFFAKNARDITVEFKYHSQGIVIKDSAGGQTQLGDKGIVYPLVEMEWVEGMPLIDKVDALCKRRDQAGLEDLVKQWLEILRIMRSIHMAHCDLAGGNVMVRPNGRLVLVDYDGVYIPDFSGRTAIVAGQADYQHPSMQQRPFNEHADGFSALVIYIALLALQLQPQLWDKYTQKAQQGVDKKLLFKGDDFVDPDRSPIFSELSTINDQRLRAAVAELRKACKQPVAQVRFPLHVIDPDYEKKQALAKLEQAIQHDDDEEIVLAWNAALLDNYPPALPHFTRIDHARRMMALLKNFRNALQTRSIVSILASYNSSLDQCKSVKQRERDTLRLARCFTDAYTNDDDIALSAVADEIRLLNLGSSFDFTLQEAQRSNLAQRRTSALARFRGAIASRSIQHIVSDYDPILDAYQHISSVERELLQTAQSFMEAIHSDDDQRIIVASEQIRNSPYASRFDFTQQVQKRIALARQRDVALAHFRSALASDNIRQVFAAYYPILDQCKNLAVEERNLASVVCSFVLAYDTDDDLALVAASTEIQKQSYSQHLKFDQEEEQRIQLACQRKTSLEAFRKALTSQQVQQIMDSYDPILVACNNLTQEEQEQLLLAYRLLKAFQGNNDRVLYNVWHDIQTSRYQNAFQLSGREQQRMALVERRITALEQFRQTLASQSNDAQQIVFAYDASLDDFPEVTPQERSTLASAREFMAMYTTVLAGIQANDDAQIASAYDEALAQQFSNFTARDLERIKRGLKRGQLEQALQNEDYGQAIRLAQELEMESHKQITDYRLEMAKQKFIKQFDVKYIEVFYQGDEVIARWQWPPDDLVRHAVILWRVDTWPRSPRREEAGTQQIWVFRSRNEQLCTARFKVIQHMPVYLHIFLAMPDETRGPHAWFYSNGYEPGSKTVARELSQI